MIQSAVDDNWLRIELLHSMIVAIYSITQGKDCMSDAAPDGKGIFFDAGLFDDINKESCAVGMLMVWSTITLEALANHALAETINDHQAVIESIEYSRKYLKKQKIEIVGATELWQKIQILYQGTIEASGVITSADKLSLDRNNIVHDKPFEYIDLGGGDVEIGNFRKRGKWVPTFRYKDIRPIYRRCDKVREFILKFFDSDHLMLHNSSFILLLEGQQTQVSGELCGSGLLDRIYYCGPRSLPSFSNLSMSMGGQSLEKKGLF